MIVEDGTGLANADSFATIAFADSYIATYHPEDTTWSALSDDVKALRLMRGTQYLEVMYRTRWVGQPTHLTIQSLAWPRAWVQDGSGRALLSSEIPTKVKQATVEMALRATAELFPDIAEPGLIKSEAVTVGPIQESKTYMLGKSQVVKYRKVELMIDEFLGTSGILTGRIYRG